MMLEFLRMSDEKDNPGESNGLPSYMWHGKHRGKFAAPSVKSAKVSECSTPDTSHLWRGGGYHGNLKRAFSALFGGAVTATVTWAEITHEAQEQMNEEQRRNMMQGREPWDSFGITESDPNNPYRQN